MRVIRLPTPTPNPSPQGGGVHPQRRGTCPGLSAPMPTGDGLLVRLLPTGTIPLAAFADLCGAARTHGNGIVEITSRGSIQVRGLSAASASQFAAAISASQIAAAGGIPVLINPLAGLDAEEILDVTALAADLRSALAQRALATGLAAKVSIAIDGRGALTLDATPVDVRLVAEAVNGAISLRVTVGGDVASSSQLGYVAVSDTVEVVCRLLDVLAERGRAARTRSVITAEGVAPFQSAVANLLLRPDRPRDGPDQALDSRWRGNEREGTPLRSGEVIGLHRLRDGSFAKGIGLAFGHADATALEHLAEAAEAAEANGVRTAPGRALLVIGLTEDKAAAFATAAETLGFIVRADDPRRHVVACAGAPICASAHIAARALGPLVAQAAAPSIGNTLQIHISGCAKGCAHPAPASLTIVGASDGCALIVDGCSRDTPMAVVASEELPATIAAYARKLREGGHG